MVDYLPFSGDYTNTIVRDNTIIGGYSTDTEEAGETKGENNETAIIKYVSCFSLLFLCSRKSGLALLLALALGLVTNSALIRATTAWCSTIALAGPLVIRLP